MRRRRRQRISFRAFSAVNQRQMVFEDVANRGQQGRHIAAVHPCAPPGVEYGLELFCHKADVAAPAQHR